MEPDHNKDSRYLRVPAQLYGAPQAQVQEKPATPGMVTSNLVLGGIKQSATMPPRTPNSSQDTETGATSTQGPLEGPGAASTGSFKRPALGMVPYRSLFRFADRTDKLYMLIGSIAALFTGSAQPILYIVLGNITKSFTTFNKAQYMKATIPPGEFEVIRGQFYSELITCVYQFIGLGAASCIASYVQMSFWKWAGESQTFKLRQAYFKSLLRQEIAFFDDQRRGDLTCRINADSDHVQDGISDKVGVVIQHLTTFLVAWVIAFVKGPIMAAILLIALPFSMGSAAMLGKLTGKFMREALIGYAKAGSIAEEVITAVRTVASFGAEMRETERYRVEVEQVAKKESKKGTIAGLAYAAIFFSLYASYALGFWSGAKLMAAATIDVGQLVSVFGEYLVGAFTLGNVAPQISILISARASAYRLFEVIERASKVDPFDSTGEKPESVRGTIEFKEVNFAYPTRPHVPVMQGFNLTIHAGQTVALVGQSGSGRFYLPQSGQILLDGRRLETLNIHWLRSQIGYVGQEPVLFSGTIRHNIALGAYPRQVTDDEIFEALKKANAYQFVMDLPDQLNTVIGERGANMSGGQCQRIAIARALIRDPRIIVLDEATSALDAQSESLVNDALESASQGRTAIVIAHRLSTIRDADVIVAMRKGEIVEIGSHFELIARKGFYYTLVQDQRVIMEHEHDFEEADEEESGSDEREDEVNDDSGSFFSKRRESSVRASQPSLRSADSKSRARLQTKDEIQDEKSPFWRVLRMNADKWHWIALGAFAAMVAGCITPAYAYAYAHSLAAFGGAFTFVQGVAVPDPVALEAAAATWGLVFLVIAIIAAISNYLQTATFTVSGEAVVYKIRVKCFETILAQDCSFFDRVENSVGALTSKLALDCNNVRKLVGDTLGSILQVIVSIVAGISLAIFSCWQLALVVIGCAPLILVSGVYQSRIMRGLNVRDTENPAGQLVSEVVGNIRTISSLGIEEYFMEEFFRRLEGPKARARKNAFIGAIAFAVSACIVYFVYATSFYYAGYLNDLELYDFDDLFSSITTVIFSAQMGGRIAAFLPDFTKAQVAAIQVFRLLDRAPTVDFRSQPKTALRPETINGDVAFQHVHFRYPSRPKFRVHRSLSFKIPAGSKVALVGVSGCGKTTVIQQLERFYDPDRGKITIDGIDIAAMDINVLRSHLALVGQQPILFDTTVYENIKYGAVDPKATTEEDVYAAAKAANLHEFIQGLPMGYNTPAGEKGGLLSGGQRQRIAIARALMRKPTILLLDEATSALDAESEVLVQSALDCASQAKGRTTITVAHRLSTVQSSDIIFVLQNGRVVEQGKHKELINKRGAYFALVEAQMESSTGSTFRRRTKQASRKTM